MKRCTSVSSSVITATYNRAATIGHALASLRRSMRTDWEQFVVDDGSRGDTRRIIKGRILTFLDSDAECLPVGAADVLLSEPRRNG